MARIFLCYRRDDNAFAVDIIDEVLSERFGRDAIVRDIDTFPLGRDFRLVIQDEVNTCDILLAIIGDRWLDMRHSEGPKSGQRRVDDLTDFVRLEIETALERDIPVIPVLVDGARMPAETDLPESLQPLVYRGAAEVRAGRDRQIHINRLVSGIEAVIEPPQPNPSAEMTPSDLVVQSSESETVAHEIPSLVDSSSAISPLSDSSEPSSTSSQTPAPIRRNWQWRRPAVLALLGLLIVGIGILAVVQYRPTPERELPNFAQSSDQPGKPSPAVVASASVGEAIPPQAPKSDLAARVDLEKIPAVSVARSLPKTYTNSIGMEFVLIPAGTFMMGSSASDQNAEDDEKPSHEVTISKLFYMGKYEVTQEEWEKVMGTTIQEQHKKATYNLGLRGVGANYPMYYVSWEDAQTFIKKLNAKEGSVSYRLPTEAEWEYAVRAGATTVYHFGNGEAQLGQYAWIEENADQATHPVGQKQVNPWGLYDMHGNVWEWVQDGYAPYTAESVTDPTGPEAGALRVFRGGSWNYLALFARSANRARFHPGYRNVYLGFRCLSSGPSQ